MEEKDDDEISLDFSKVKKFFKRRKKQPKEGVKVEGEDEDSGEDISLDFSKVKDFFRKKEELPKEKVEEEEPAEKEVKISEEEKTKKKEVKEKPKEEVKEYKEEVLEEGSEDDEDISLDLSGVKNIFKKKEKPKEEVKEKSLEKEKELGKEPIKEEKEETVEKDEEISFDFGKAKDKIKGIFKGLKEGGKEGKVKEDGEEISIDLKKGLSFFNKNKKYLVPLLIILIGMFFSVHLRLYSLNLPITEGWARNNIINFNEQVISAQVEQVYPNLPAQNKKNLINDELNKLLNSGSVYIPTGAGVQQVSYKDAIREWSKSFKSRLQDESGQTYLLAIDPYFWMRHTANVLKNGHPGDTIKDGRPWDTYMLAPGGRPVPVNDMFHAYFQAYLYKFLSFFNRDLLLKNMIFYVPVLLSALSVIPAFFIARRIGGNVGGLIAALIVAIHPSFLGRTAGGFADTDAYNVLLPLIITWIFLEAFETRELKKKNILAVLAGFFCGVYSFIWLGWWYIFDFLMVAWFIRLVYYVILHRKDLSKGFVNFIKQPAIKNTLMLAILFFISSLFFVTIFTNFGRFSIIFSGPSSIVTLHEVGITTIWPNVFTTVAEQNEVSIQQAIDQISFGQRFLFFIAVLGIILTLLKKDMHGEVDVKYVAILVIWFIGSLYGSTRGVRFVLLLVPAFAIAFGVGLGVIYQIITKWITKEIGVSKVVSQVAVFVLISLLLISPIKAGDKTAKNEIPSMDDAWYNSLKNIDNVAEPDAIINSWWDFGHWFKMVGNRAVTFDGTSQNSPQAHWIGKTLLTANEHEAIGILRMLDCSGADHKVLAFDELNKEMEDGARTIDLIYEIIVLDKDGARNRLLSEGVEEEKIDLILSYTHCEPPEDYFITSEDMIGKSGVWAHFGSWDFNRALMYNTLKKKEYRNDMEKSISFLQNRFNYSRDNAENVYYAIQSIADSKEANSWISPWPSYASGVDPCDNVGEDAVSCSVGDARVVVNLTTMEASINTQEGIKHPNSLVYVTEDDLVEKTYDDGVGFGLVLVPKGNGYERLLTAPQLSSSMFTRLFYLEGHGLKHFEKLSDETGVFGERIIVWKVDWNGEQENLVYMQKEFEEVEVVEEIIEEDVNESEEEVVVEEVTNETELDTILDEIISET